MNKFPCKVLVTNHDTEQEEQGGSFNWEENER